MAWGQDDAEVKMTGRPQSLGLEDRYRNSENKVKENAIKRLG